METKDLLKIFILVLELRKRKTETDFHSEHITREEMKYSNSILNQIIRKCSDVKYLKSYIDAPKYWEDAEYETIKELLEINLK